MQSYNFYRIPGVIIGSFSNASVGQIGYIIDDRLITNFTDKSKSSKCTPVKRNVASCLHLDIIIDYQSSCVNII